ncbi:MAG: ABC transporter permease [Bacilli bacterium]|nr:ABC transporter permease [Bacilli bacterium]
MKTYSTEHQAYLNKLRKERIWVFLFQFFIALLFFGIWEWLGQNHLINTFLYSYPSKMMKMISSLLFSQHLLHHIGITLFELIISFFISFCLGMFISIMLWLFPFCSKVIDPYLTILNSLPKVALGPLIIIWCGANTTSIIFMSLLISIFICIINTYQGFSSVPTHYIIMAKSFGANKWQIFRKIVLPSNIHPIISTMKVVLSMNLIGVIMGELLVSKKGLGYLIMYGSQVFNLDLVISCIFILCLISYLLYLLINKIK